MSDAYLGRGAGVCKTMYFQSNKYFESQHGLMSVTPLA